MMFNDLGVSESITEALARDGIVEPTPVQQKAYAAIAEGKSVYISSETGTGKTLAYLLPLLAGIDASGKDLQAIIVVPTHELALQVKAQVDFLTRESDLELRSQLLIGASSVKRQIEKLKAKPHVVIGSPGRIVELITLRKLKAHTVKSVVVDEADKLLFDDALDNIRQIIKSLFAGRQLIFCSATVQADSHREALELDPELIEVHTATNKVVDTIAHYYLESDNNSKPEALRKLIRAAEPERAMVFVHLNETAEKIMERLTERKIAAVIIHGQQDKYTRKKALDDFRAGIATVLVTSDVSARGMDIKGVSHIINLDVPGQSSNYLHRVGRTGRAGEAGCAISIASRQEIRIIKRYERELKIEIVPIILKDGEIFPKE